MAVCGRHPSAGGVPLPGDPSVTVCPRCPTILSGTPKSRNRAGVTLQDNTSAGGGLCLLMVAAFVTVLGLAVAVLIGGAS